MALRLTRGLIAEIHAYTSGVLRARAEYADHPTSNATVRKTCRCTDEVTCAGCRRKAQADVLVATSIEECAELFKIIDKPAPKMGRHELQPCGTNAARRRHWRRGETCSACRVDQDDRANCESCGERLVRKKAGGMPKRFCNQRCRRAARKERP